MYFTNDWCIFCFGSQCRDARLFSMDVKNQVKLLHRIEDWIKLLNILDAILRISSNLARINFGERSRVGVLEVVPRLGKVSANPC